MRRVAAFYANLFRDNSQWFKAIVFWFLISAAIGAITYYLKPEILKDIISGFSDKFGANPTLDFHLAMQIFLQNLIVSAIALFGGIIFGLTSVIVVGLNGFILGFVVLAIFLGTKNNFSQSITLVIDGLVPHGIFELPAFFIASALGLKLGTEWLSPRAFGLRFHTLKTNIKLALLAMPAIALVLFIAALIEVFVSGRLVGKL